MNTNEQTKETDDQDPRDFGGRGRCRGRGGKKKMLLIPVFIAAVVLVKSAVVMVLWNYLIPDLFHGPEVSYLQAMALTVLAKLFTGFGGRGGFGRGRFGRHGHGPWGQHRGPWANMSREEKDKLREELRERFGHRGHRGPGENERGKG